MRASGICIHVRNRVARFVLAAMLLAPGATLAACDREDARDVQEGVNDADRQIDKLDTDGKDD